MSLKELLYDEATIGMKFTTSVPLTADFVRAYAEVVDDLNPVYWDDEAARRLGFEKAVAPYNAATFYTHIGRSEEWKQPSGTIHLKQELRFHRPAYVGDTITTASAITEKYERRGRRHVVMQLIATNQKGELVVEGKRTTIWP